MAACQLGHLQVLFRARERAVQGCPLKQNDHVGGEGELGVRSRSCRDFLTTAREIGPCVTKGIPSGGRGGTTAVTGVPPRSGRELRPLGQRAFAPLAEPDNRTVPVST